LIDTSDKKTKKKKYSKRKIPKTTLKKSLFYLIIFSNSLFFFTCCILVLYPQIQFSFLSKIIENTLINTPEIRCHFDQARLNFWDFSINLRNFQINNPTFFPEEFAIHSDDIQTKLHISSTFKLKYSIYINNLQLNLYYIPGKGTNIGSLLKSFKEQEKQNHKSIFANINSISIDRVGIIISQNLEPQKIEINITNSKQNPYNLTSDKNFMELVIDSLIIGNKDIPEDFRTSLINDMKQNTI